MLVLIACSKMSLMGMEPVQVMPKMQRKMLMRQRFGRLSHTALKAPGNHESSLGMPFLEKNRSDLEEHGYTVVKDVLTEAECTRYIQEYFDWIQNNFDEGVFPHCEKSLIRRYKIGHFSPTWSARLKTKPAFEELWGTKQLLTSVDAVAIGRPPEQGEEKFHSPDQSWLHLDQGAGRIGIHAYQGGLYLETADLDDWVFECMDGSHQHFERFWLEHPAVRETSINGSEHLQLKEDDIQWYLKMGCQRRRVAVPRGGLLLWDSRLVHNNLCPIKGRAHSDRWRFVVIVCMAPASWADKGSLDLKTKAYREVYMTNHWPSNGVRLFPDILPPEAPRARHPLKSLPKVATTLEVQQLMGVVPYDNLEDGVIPKPAFSPDYKPAVQPPEFQQ